MSKKSVKDRGQQKELDELRLREEIIQLLDDKCVEALDDEKIIEVIVNNTTDIDSLLTSVTIQLLAKILLETEDKPTLTIDERITDVLVKALKSSESGIQRQAAYALAMTKDKTFVEPLLETINDKDSSVRSATTYALGHIGDKRALKFLIQLYQEEQEASVRSTTLQALRNIDKEKAKPLIIEALEDEDGGVRLVAIRLVKDIIDESVIPKLERLSKKDQPRGIRSAAKNTLKDLGIR